MSLSDEGIKYTSTAPLTLMLRWNTSVACSDMIFIICWNPIYCLRSPKLKHTHDGCHADNLLRFFQSLSDITMMFGITMVERDELWHDENMIMMMTMC